MRGEECDVVGNRLLGARRIDRKVAEIATLEFRALPCHRPKIGRGRK